MANKRFIDFPIATTVGDNDIILIWQGGANKQTTKATILSGVPDSLNDLTDVTISGLTNGQILRYDSVTGQWENTDQGNLDLNDLNDVTIVSPTNGQVLVYNSSTSKWENSSGGYVPYVGAVTTVNLGAQSIQAGSFVKQGGTASQFLKADGSVDSTAYGTGSVTSVGLTMPAAFNVANSPITTSGTLAVTGAGTVGQYIRGDGSLADFPQSSGGGSSVSYYLNGSVDQGTIGGIAYKELSKVPILGAGTDFTINADGYIASFITDAGDPNLLEIPGGNWNFETYFSASSSGGTPTFYVELYKVSGTTATLIASSSSAPELIAFGTNLNPYFSTLAVPTTTLALTDRLAVRYYVTHSGRTITLHTENNHLCQIVTTFTTGITALNGLTAQVQNFAVGTSGTDFNIASATATHTFNLPTASATNRGALSSADWSTFNAKQNALTLTTSGTSGAATLVGATLNIPQYQAAGTYITSVTASSPLASSGGTTPNITIQQASGSQSGFLSSTDWTTFNNKQNALTNPVTGTGTTDTVPKFTGTSSIGDSQIIDNGTRVGIGVSPTTNKLEVGGGITIGTGTTLNTDIRINNATNGKIQYIFSDSSTGELGLESGTSVGIKFNTNGPNTRLIITSDGTLGFNGSSNVGNAGLDKMSMGYLNGNYGWIQTWSGTRLLLNPSGNNVVIGSTSDNGARFQVSGRTTINAGSLSGTFGLNVDVNSTFAFGSTNGRRTATITRDSGDKPGLQFGYDATDNTGIIAGATETIGAGIDFYTYNGSSWGNRMRITSSGNFLIGTTTDNGARLQVSGNGNFFSNSSTAGNANGIRVEQAGTGDSAISFLLTGVREWLVGIDNSDSDTFKINNNTGGSDFNNVGLAITTTGAATFSSSVTAASDSSFNGVNVGRGGGSIFTNTRIGNLAFVNNTTGANNTSVGYGSLGSNTTGNGNSAFGKDSLALNTSGTNNSALGLNALVSNTTGGTNTSLGFSSLGNNTTGSNNAALGSYAGSFVTGGGPNNTSSNSVYLGADSRGSASGNTNEIVIGYDARGQGSNTAVIGNSSITKTILNGNVGIGTPSPSSRLHVEVPIEIPATGAVALIARTSNGANDIFRWFDGATQLGVFKNNGNVLIGTTTDNGHKLAINAGGTSGLRIDVNSGVNGISMSPGAEFNIDKPGIGGGTFKINSSGNVLIGTTTDNGQKLQVEGNVFVNDNLSTGNGVQLRGADRPLITRGWDAFTSGTKTGVGRWGVYMEPAELFLGSPGTDYTNGLVTIGGWLVNGTRQPNLTVNNQSRNVLIGTTTDVGAKLYVNGDIRTGALGGGYVSGYWKLGRAILGTQPTETYQIIVEINGALYAIGAANL